MKKCVACGNVKPIESFHKAKRLKSGGHSRAARCKSCRSAERKPSLAGEREEVRALALSGLKRCRECLAEKDFSQFCKRKASPDGLNYKCRECQKKYLERWRTENPKAHSKWYQENKESRSDYGKLWRSENIEGRALYMRQWGIENAVSLSARNAKRNADKIRATPGWADHERIREIYAESARKTLETGIKHNVDHIYPLNSDFVCGLHCEANLAVITKFENIRKLNRMPTEDYLSRVINE